MRFLGTVRHFIQKLLARFVISLAVFFTSTFEVTKPGKNFWQVSLPPKFEVTKPVNEVTKLVNEVTKPANEVTTPANEVRGLKFSMKIQKN